MAALDALVADLAEAERRAEAMEACDCIPDILSSRSCEKCGRRGAWASGRWHEMVAAADEAEARAAAAVRESDRLREALTRWHDLGDVVLDFIEHEVPAEWDGGDLGYSRKGVTHERVDVVHELADVAITAYVALSEFSGAPWESLGERAAFILDRRGARAVVLEGAARQEQTQDLGGLQSRPCEGSGGEQR